MRAAESRRRASWCDWRAVLDALPSLHGQTVLDLGCGPGEIAAMLVARGAHVIGIDGNDDDVREARGLQLSNAEFRTADLRSLPDVGVSADGLWCSFAAAYFPDLSPTLARWRKNLKPGGWIALTEIDDFFAHEPLSERTKNLLSAYADDALEAGRYDFRMGRKLGDLLERSGFVVTKMLTLEDEDLSFEGPARPEVLDAWRARFTRMQLLHDFCGASFDQVQSEFLACLMNGNHRSVAKVRCVIAVREASAGREAAA